MGPANTSGTTTVKDVLPAGITASGAASGANWSCIYMAGQTLACTTTQTVTSGAYYTDITVPARVTATTGTIQNNAVVYNPAETSACKTDGSMPVGNESVCDRDPKNTDPAVIVLPTNPPVLFPYVSIHKYAKTIDTTGDSQTAPVSIALGEKFNYYYQLSNTGSAAATSVVVKDTLPAYLTFSGAIIVRNPAGTDVTSDWTVSTGSQIFGTETVPRIYLVMTKKTDLEANSGIYTFTIPVVLSATAPAGTSMQNIVYACATNMANNPTGPNGEVICGNTNPPPPPPVDQCDRTNPTAQKDPACIVVPGAGFDLRVKKYIGTNDAQPGSALSTSNGAALSYIIRVQNSGPMASTGVTTVQDILPTGVVLDGTTTGSNWTCSATGVTIRCTSSLVVASGSYYPDITVPFRVTATASQTVINIAAVDNPNESSRCMSTGSLLPMTDSAYCTRDPQNSDPAVLTIPGGPGGGVAYFVPTCVNGIASCTATSVGCTNVDGAGAACYTTTTLCNAANTLSCDPTGPGGPSGSSSRCGDYVLNVSAGEECDLGDSLNSDASNATCSKTCKLNLWTNPGANPITSMWIRIPALGGIQRIGDGSFLRIPLDLDGSTPDAYRIVVGRDTNLFTLADQVIFGVNTQYQIPIIVPADKAMCLQASGNAVNSPAGICTTFGAAAPTTDINGQRYVILGAGTYQQRDPSGNYTQVSINRPVSEALLFKGSTQYIPLGETNIGPTLRDAFR